MPSLKHINTASKCMLSISTCLMSPVRYYEDVSSLIACSCVLTYDYMQQHEVTIDDIKNLVDNETANSVIDEVYNNISRDIDKLRARLEA